MDAAPFHALLIVDVVGSTALTQRLGDHAAAQWWATHDRLARDLLASWHGREIDKTDGFLLLFANVGDAAGYALARTLTAERAGEQAAARNSPYTVVSVVAM